MTPDQSRQVFPGDVEGRLGFLSAIHRAQRQTANGFGQGTNDIACAPLQPVSGGTRYHYSLDSPLTSASASRSSARLMNVSHQPISGNSGRPPLQASSPF